MADMELSLADATHAANVAETATEIMMQFISLGQNCEFGFAQRAFGAEPLDLLRWASTPLSVLIEMLRNRFKGIGDADQIRIRNTGEYMVDHLGYHFTWHAFAKENEISLEALKRRECIRLPRMAEVMIDHLTDGRRICVVKRDNDLTPDAAAPLLAAIRGYGSCPLLLVHCTDIAEKASTVTDLGDGLLLGYLQRFADPANVPATTDAEAWLALCRNALGVWRSSPLGETRPIVDGSPGSTNSQSRLIHFGGDGAGRGLLGEGWWAPEAGHVWSNGASSSLFVHGLDPCCDQTLRFELAPYVCPLTDKTARLAIFAGEQAVGRFDLAGVRQTIEVTVPAKLIPAGGSLSLRLQHPDFGRPSDHGHGDSRPLGICMFTLLIRSTRNDKKSLHSPGMKMMPFDSQQVLKDKNIANLEGKTRRDDEEFDEELYLYFNPDLAKAVQEGRVKSAREHYFAHGRREGRWAKSPAAMKSPKEFWSDFMDVRSRHIDDYFLCPKDLMASSIIPRRFVVVGSCFAESWHLHNSGSLGCQGDFILTNHIAQLPAEPPEGLASYDFQVVQIALRSVMHDNLLWDVPIDDDKRFVEIFNEVRRHLVLQVHHLLKWNREGGLLTFITNFLVPQQNPNGRLMPRYHLSNPAFFIEQINVALGEIVAQHKNVFLLDVDTICASIGKRYIQDDSINVIAHGTTFSDVTSFDGNRIEPTPTLLEHYEVPSSPIIRKSLRTFSRSLSNEILAAYRTIRQTDMVKAVVCDLDDTLWRGVSGEREDVDPEMMEGWPLGLVEALAYVKRRGILLAVISKNEESRIRQIWDRIMMGRLKMSDFASIKINWKPKVDNMSEILSEFNLLPRSVVFIDDNPVERSSMKATFPDLRVIGRFPYYVRRDLLWSPETQVAAVTKESARRTEMIQAQIQRDLTRKELGREEFLQTLSLSCKMIAIRNTDDVRFARSIELINKTNQFNTTGRRWRIDECDTAFAAGTIFHAFEVQDKFVGYGLVGVVIRNGTTIEQFVMSCRVVGLEIEIAVMSSLMRQLRSAGVGSITALFEKTDANLLCRDVFRRCGFHESNGTWTWSGGDLPEMPSHVALT